MQLIFSPVVFLLLILVYLLWKLLTFPQTNRLSMGSCSEQGEPQAHQTHFHVSFIPRTLRLLKYFMDYSYPPKLFTLSWRWYSVEWIPEEFQWDARSGWWKGNRDFLSPSFCIFLCFLSFLRPMLKKKPVLEVLLQVVEPSGESLIRLPFLLSISWSNEKRLGSKTNCVKLLSDETVWGRSFHLKYVAYKKSG